jgi:hypothetical protein
MRPVQAVTTLEVFDMLGYSHTDQDDGSRRVGKRKEGVVWLILEMTVRLRRVLERSRLHETRGLYFPISTIPEEEVILERAGNTISSKARSAFKN